MIVSFVFYICSLFEEKNIIDYLLFHPITIDLTNSYLKLFNDNLKRSNTDVNIENKMIPTLDDELLDAMIYRHKQNHEQKKWILFSHGNAGNIFGFQHKSLFLSKYYNVISYDYRGFGRSTGKPSEYGLYIDSLSIWNYLIKELNVNSNDIILYGESLGSSVSSMLCNILTNVYNMPPYKLIIVAGFTSIKNLTNDILDKMQLQFLRWFFDIFIDAKIFSTYDNLLNVKDIVPIEIYHSYGDEVIPISNAFRNSQIEKTKLYIVNGSHNVIHFNDKDLRRMGDLEIFDT